MGGTRNGRNRGLLFSADRRQRNDLPGSIREDAPVRALLLIVVESFAVIAAHAFGHQNPRTVDGAPFTRFLTDAARVALGPALDAEDGQVGKQPERGAHGAEESAIQIAYE